MIITLQLHLRTILVTNDVILLISPISDNNIIISDAKFSAGAKNEELIHSAIRLTEYFEKFNTIYFSHYLYTVINMLN